MKALSTLKLKFGLLNFDVKVYGLRNKEDTLNFNSLSSCCHQITGLKRFCKSCMKELEWKSELKGYKISKNLMVELTKAELETIERLENGIEILFFVKSAEIPLSILDKPYFLEPINSISIKLYTLFNSVFAERNIYAVCRSIEKGNEHFAVLRHDKLGLILQHIERISDLMIAINKSECSKEELTQFKEIIEQNVKEFDFAELKPVYVEKVKKLIEAKAEGKSIELKEITTEKMDTNLLATLKIMSKQKESNTLKTKKKIEIKN